MAAAPTLVEAHPCFGGVQEVWEHRSEATGTPMRYGLFTPPQPGPRPALWFLSGLTCTEQNVITKGGLQRDAARLGLTLVCPDTSPRGANVPGEGDRWDLGLGASYYIDATRAPWSAHYRMERWLIEELPAVLAAHHPRVDLSRQSITGHSMGGHGALVLALRHPGRFRSVSAIAPICNPSESPWGEHAFTELLGDDRALWAAHDATALVRAGAKAPPLFIDQGDADPFLESQLRPERLRAACEEAGQLLTLRVWPGYDHGYYFVATVAADHVEHAAAALRAQG
ncbi:S-formylglutathione hydrolase [Myxococcota bacterium]|nr:S-formylglutathione hydrolase [Myxococcota bacterium]